MCLVRHENIRIIFFTHLDVCTDIASNLMIRLTISSQPLPTLTVIATVLSRRSLSPPKSAINKTTACLTPDAKLPPTARPPTRARQLVPREPLRPRESPPTQPSTASCRPPQRIGICYQPNSARVSRVLQIPYIQPRMNHDDVPSTKHRPSSSVDRSSQRSAASAAYLYRFVFVLSCLIPNVLR